MRRYVLSIAVVSPVRNASGRGRFRRLQSVRKAEDGLGRAKRRRAAMS